MPSTTRAADEISVSQYRAWLRRRPENAGQKAPAERALKAFESLIERPAITATDLTPVVEVVRSPYFIAWEIGTELLRRLAERHPVARTVIADLMGSGRANLRVRALGLVHDGLPKAFCVELVRRGLSDRSKLVRQTAANVARCFILSELLPDLDHAVAAERDPDTRFQLEYAVGLIRDIYFVYTDANGERAFVIRTSDGYPAELMYPGEGWCTPADIAERGHRPVAEQIRRDILSRPRSDYRPFRWDR